MHEIPKPKKAPKDRNVGSDLLIPWLEWVDRSQIQGNDEIVLKAPIMETAFNRILELHEPKKKIAICSLCTVTRPYSIGKKWKAFKEAYSDYADLIVNSNGGVIPLEFEECYPYLTYDAHGEKKYDEMYIEIVGERVKTFFTTHKYDYIMFNFRHNLRNSVYSESVGQWLKENGYIKDYAVMPSKELYEQSQKENFSQVGYSMFPELFPTMMNPVLEQIKEWNDSLE